MQSANILLCQLEVSQRKDMLREWVEAEEAWPQLERCWELMREENSDLVVIPETCYLEEYEEQYSEYSRGRIIVAGTAYDDAGINSAHVFKDGKHVVLRKIFTSPVEVMELNHPNTRRPDEIVREWESRIVRGDIPEYFVEMPGGGLAAILTCMDYYRLGYYIANSTVISPLLWGLVAPSSNGQQGLFLRLSQAMHDVCDRVYSIVVNSRDNSRPSGWDQGKSYVYGPITRNVKEHMRGLGQTDEHLSAIYRMGDGASALSMRLVPGGAITFFARSQGFRSTPTHVREMPLK